MATNFAQIVAGMAISTAEKANEECSVPCPSFVRPLWIFDGENWSPPPPDPLEAGYTVQPEGFTLAIKDADRAAFTSLLVLVQEAQIQGVITDETPQSISDKDGVRHEVTTLRFRQIMLGYGQHFKTLWDNFQA